jgi:hypothetical protein
VSHVLADLAVAARRAALQHAVAVDERDREPVDLRLRDVLEARILDPLAREVRAHARDPGAQLLGRADVREREQRLQVPDLLELRDRRAADALRRRVRRDELGMLGLDRPQLVEQGVVGVVADLGVVEDVVAVPVVLELPAQLRGALVQRAHSTSRAAGSSSRARS